MRNQWKKLLGLGVISVWLGASALAQAATGVGPYYAMPSWDQTLPAATRFIDLTNMPGAVLDRETGLVWERSPDPTLQNWQNAQFHCLNRNTGGRTGWRLPALPELMSLVDRSQFNPALPAGHPFTNVQSNYWSATTHAASTTSARNVAFLSGVVGLPLDKSNNSLFVWCVRGGPGADAQ